MDFNWFPRDYFAFEFGHRLSDFKSSTVEEHFTSEIERLCDLALVKVNEYKQILVDNKTAAQKLQRLHKDKSNGWEKFNLGILFAIGGHNDQGMKYLKQVTGEQYQLDWEIERDRIARQYMKAIEQGNFMTILGDIISRTRELKQLR